MTDDSQTAEGSGHRYVTIAGRRIPVPASPAWRIALGSILVVGGIFGFLPILGFWMVPLGLIMLSIDFPPIRRFRRRAEVRIGRWWTSLRLWWKGQ